jgi:glycosyltransferase involved in cell wall biosynthesis
MLEALDAYGQPSWYEAHCLLILEAGVLDLPGVASEVGGTRETHDDGRAGLVVPARDPAALAAAVIRMVRLADLRRQAGLGLGERVRACYTNERIVTDTTAFYDELSASCGSKVRG